MAVRTSSLQMPATLMTYVAFVDDDESLRRSFSRVLRLSGLIPVAYDSAESFLADQKRPRFDCMVFDVQLTGMSGLDLARQLNVTKDVTPIIFITAHDDPSARMSAHMIGCAGYFTKADPGRLIIDAIYRAIGLSPPS